MSAFSEIFKTARAGYTDGLFGRNVDERVAEIIYFYERSEDEKTRVNIGYETIGGWEEEYVFPGSFAELVRAMVLE